MKRLLYLPVLCAFIVGCAPKPSDTPAPTPTNPNDQKTVQTETKPGEPSSGTEAPKPAADLSLLPAELKHDGYEFYGLGNTKPMDIEVASSPDGQIYTGTQTMRLDSVKDGKAVFRCDRTGGLGEMVGSDVYSLEPTGVYVVSSTVAKTKGHDKELPNKLAPGTTWDDTTEIEIKGQSLKMKDLYKVVGVQKVTTKKGSYDALLITSSGRGTVGGKNVRMDTKYWYVKGIGNVKTEMKMTGTDGATRTVVYQVV